MKKAVAVFLCLALLVVSSMISTRLRLDKQLEEAAAAPAKLAAFRNQLSAWTSHFPGSIFIPLSGFSFS